MLRLINKIAGLSYYLKEKGFFHLLSANILIQTVSFASQLFVAGILLPEDLGRIKIVQTYLTIFLIIAGMGFNASTLKLCSENRSENERKNLFHSALFFTLISTIAMYVLILVFNYLNILSSDKLIHSLIPIGIFPIITNSLFIVFVSYFQSIKKIKTLSNLTVSNKLISITSIIIITYFWGIYGYYVAFNISFILILMVSIHILGTKEFRNVFNFRNIQYFKIHWKYARPSMFAYFLSELSAYVDIIIISYFGKDMNQIGYYSFALTITVIFRLFPSTVQQITIPYFSRLSNNRKEFEEVHRKYNRILYWVVATTLLSALIVFPTAIQWIFSGKYNPSIIYFPWLAIGWSLRQTVLLQTGAIFSLGKVQYNVYISLITLIFNIITISTSVYFFGLNGACFANIFGGFVIMIGSKYFYQKALNEKN